jgi:hypothetical protein
MKAINKARKNKNQGSDSIQLLFPFPPRMTTLEFPKRACALTLVEVPIAEKQ